jgi:hypothetical protein
VELNTKEDLRFLRRLLVELNKQADLDITAFSCEIKRTEAEFDVVDKISQEVIESIQCRTCWIEICWRPRNSNISEMKHIDKVELNWNPGYGQMSLELRGTSAKNPAITNGRNLNNDIGHMVNYEIGYGAGFSSENADIKKMFVRLLKKVKHHKEVTIPQKNKEKFENSCYEMFPNLLDEIFMENLHDDSKEG